MFDELLEEFWSWWETVRDDLRDAIAGETETEIPAQLSSRLQQLHPELTWQLTPGVTARHSLNVASGGSRLLRLITGRWALFGPAADSDWEYSPARLPFSPGIVDVRGVEVDPDFLDLSYTVDTLFERVDFEVTHPAFDALDYEESREVTLELLDAILGEDEVERWMGMLEIVDEVTNPIRLEQVPGEVAAAQEQFSGVSWEDGSRYYDGDVVAKINRSAKWINNLGRPLHMEVTMESLASDDRGLPTPLEERRLDEISRQLVEALGENAILVAVATGDAERTLYLYGAAAEVVDEVLSEWKASNSNREINVEIAADEQWANAEQWD